MSFKARMLKNLIHVLCAGFLLSSCSDNYVYQKKHEFPGERWTYQDSINFDFTISDTLKIYNLYLEVEHGDAYPYQNIYTMTHTRFPGGQRPAQQLNIDLAEKSGKWQGKKSGSTWLQRVDLQRGAYFSQLGNYTLTLHQYMRSDSLPALKSIKFAIEQTENQRDATMKEVKKERKGNAEAQRKYLPER